MGPLVQRFPPGQLLQRHEHPVMPARCGRRLGIAGHSLGPLLVQPCDGGVIPQGIDVRQRLAPPELKRTGVCLAGRSKVAGGVAVPCTAGKRGEGHLVKIAGSGIEPVTAGCCDQDRVGAASA